MTDHAISAAPAAGKPRGLSLGGISWALHQGARDPYVILITIYVFMPYFSTVVVGVPETRPVLALRLTPAGRVPDVTV